MKITFWILIIYDICNICTFLRLVVSSSNISAAHRPTFYYIINYLYYFSARRFHLQLQIPRVSLYKNLRFTDINLPMILSLKMSIKSVTEH